jgi:hypothetical protein
MPANEAHLRELLARVLSWDDAHVDFDAAVVGLPFEAAGIRPVGAPHSAWELVEHIRLAQQDILAFCIAPRYDHRAWPDDYWPESAAPPSAGAWQTSVDAIREDRRRLAALAADPAIDLGAVVPHGTTQTYARELLLVADHTAYHVGQLVLLRQLLGNWPPPR